VLTRWCVSFHSLAKWTLHSGLLACAPKAQALVQMQHTAVSHVRDARDHLQHPEPAAPNSPHNNERVVDRCPGCVAVHSRGRVLDQWVERSSIIRHTGLFICGLCLSVGSLTHTDATYLPLLHRDVPAKNPSCPSWLGNSGQPMSTGPIDQF
jgi:hypothetical protein